LWARIRPAAGYLLLTFPTALATMVMFPLLIAVAMTTAAGGAGLFLMPRAMAGIHRWADWHRWRAGRLLGTAVEPRSRTKVTGVGARLRQLRDDPSTWRDLRWMLVQAGTGIPLGILAVFCAAGPILTFLVLPFWWLFPVDAPFEVFGIEVHGWGSALVAGVAQLAPAAVLAYWVLPPLARWHARVCLAILAPSAAEQLAERVDVLTETRTNVIDAHGAELRRIERDLHDSTQARLVAIAMQLGVARDALTENPEAVAKLLQRAHEGAEEAMVELRDVIRTIYPPILADRGLSGALTALCARSGVPAKLDLSEDVGDIPAAVQAAAYFVVAETLTNTAKHSRAQQVSVRVHRSDDELRIEVCDDGIGGVDETRGSGVVGIRRRAAALDGNVQVSSPAGGPTSIVVGLPCGS
jgi:signal transduction histidine kinase